MRLRKLSRKRQTA